MLGILRIPALTFGEEGRVDDIQPLEVLAVLTTEAPIRLPDPIPPWCVATSSGKKYDGVVRLDIEVEVREDFPGEII